MSARPDVALDVRETSHTSAGMLAYVRALRRLAPSVAPDLRFAEVGSGDNFDLAEQVGLPLALARLKPRLVHFPTPFVPRLVPVPYAVTVHDLIDLEFPQHAKRKVGPYWRLVAGPVIRRADAVITDDGATVALLERYLGVDPRRVHVIPLGIDAPDPLPAPNARNRPYFLYAGNRRPHKDLASLLTAWTSLPDRYAADVILTGAPVPGLSATREHGDLMFAGDVDEAALWSLYRGALAYVHPARREGFGLPLLEALRAGTPVVAAETATPAPLKPYVQRYEAGDVLALRRLLLQALEQPADPARGEAARAATAWLTWERTVTATTELYRTVLRARA